MQISVDAVESVVQRTLDLSQAPPADANLADHGLTSLTVVDLFLTLESELGIAFDDEDLKLTNFRSIRVISELLEVVAQRV